MKLKVTSKIEIDRVMAELAMAKEGLNESLKDRLDVNKLMNGIIWGKDQGRYENYDMTTGDEKWNEANQY